MRRWALPLLTILILSLHVRADAEDGNAPSLTQELRAISALRAHGNHDEALDRATRLIEGYPDSLPAHVAYQDLRLARGEKKELLKTYSSRSTSASATADDLYLYGRLLEGRRAFQMFKKALRLDERHFWSLCALGANEIAEGDARDAAKYLQRARDVDPRSPVPVNSLGWLAESTGDPAKAEALYKKALELDATYNLSRINLGILLISQGRFVDSEVVLDDARKAAPGDPMPLMGLGMAKAALGDLDGALGYYKQAVELDSNTVASLNLLGTAYMGLSQYDLAEEAYAKALRDQPENVTTLLNLGYLYLSQGDVSGAQVWLKRALKADSRSAEAYYFLGLCMERSGETRDAERAYLKAAKLDDENPVYAKALGVLDANLGRWKDALEAYGRAAELSGRTEESLLDLAFAYVGAGDPRRAVVVFEEILEKNPENLTAWMNLGLLSHQELNDKERAIQAYEEYLKRGGTDDRVREWLQELR